MARRLVSNIILGIIGVLAIALIVMAIVPKSYSIGVSSKPYQIAVYGNNSSSYQPFVNTGDLKDEYQKISKAYSNSFSTSSIDALFSKIITEKAEYGYAENKSLYNIVSDASSKGAIVMEFRFDKLHTLKKDGKAYKCSNYINNAVYKKGVITYSKVWIVVSDNNGFDDIEFYFQKVTNADDVNENTSTTASVKVTTIANTHNLYKTLQEIRTEHNI